MRPMVEILFRRNGIGEACRLRLFVQNSETKNAVRDLTSPIPDVATFNMQRVEDPKQENPSGFDSSSSRLSPATRSYESSSEGTRIEKSERLRSVEYMTAGENHDPVEKIRETYTARIVYQDVNAKIVGNDSSKLEA